MSSKKSIKNFFIRNQISQLYKLTNLLNHKALYNIITSGRKRGKSSAVKSFCCEESIKEKRKFALIFRTREGKTQKKIEKFLNEWWLKERISKWSGFEGLTVQQDRFFLFRIEDGKRVVDTEEIGAVCYIDEDEELKSMVFENYYNIYFEEFISRYGYLQNEVVMFESIISTVLRFNIYDENAHIFLVGNTISRVCPYFSEWQIDIANQQEETIIERVIEREIEGQIFTIKIAAERLKNLDEGVSLSEKGKQMDSGEWETGQVSLFKGNKKDYDLVYEFVYFYQGFCFLLNCLSKEEELFIFCEKKTTPIKKETRVISDVDSFNPLYTKDFVPITPNERIIFNLLKQNKIFFSDSLTGADFYNCLASQRREIKYL